MGMFPWLAMRKPDQNICTLKLNIYDFLNVAFAWARVGGRTNKTVRPILIFMELFWTNHLAGKSE